MRGRYRRSMGELRFSCPICLTGLLTVVFRAITLTKNSQFYVRQGDVERLIAQGYLQKLG